MEIISEFEEENDGNRATQNLQNFQQYPFGLLKFLVGDILCCMFRRLHCHRMPLSSETVKNLYAILLNIYQLASLCLCFVEFSCKNNMLVLLIRSPESDRSRAQKLFSHQLKRIWQRQKISTTNKYSRNLYLSFIFVYLVLLVVLYFNILQSVTRFEEINDISKGDKAFPE